MARKLYEKVSLFWFWHARTEFGHLVCVWHNPATLPATVRVGLRPPAQSRPMHRPRHPSFIADSLWVDFPITIARAITSLLSGLRKGWYRTRFNSQCSERGACRFRNDGAASHGEVHHLADLIKKRGVPAIGDIAIENYRNDGDANVAFKASFVHGWDRIDTGSSVAMHWHAYVLQRASGWAATAPIRAAMTRRVIVI